jgi:thermostable 8-oxoguanine DNA glycosylase
MFDIDKTNEAIENSIEEYWAKAKEEIEEELTSAGYNHIFDNVKVEYTQEGFSINLDFKDDIKTEDQDVMELLARGGVLMKKDGSYIEVKPSSVLIKYLSKR